MESVRIVLMQSSSRAEPTGVEEAILRDAEIR
jgi:hypothetical protein